MSEPFDAAWQRWERAQTHLKEAVAAWNSYVADHDAFDFVLDDDGFGTYILRVLQVRPMPVELAVAVGEWLYNLRATLDYIVWATACYVAGVVPPPSEGQLQYPIYDEKAAWDRNTYRLKGLHPHHRDMLLRMQPFNGDVDANYLGWINRLARTDRHRRLVTGAARLVQVEPVLQVPAGSRVKLEWGERTVLDGHADVARVTVTPYVPGMEISVNPRVGIDPEIGEWASSPFWGPIAFDERLRMMQIFVSAEIAAYEYDCTGRSRKGDLLSDDFRSECDSRRPSVAALTRKRSPVRWTLAGPGKPATARSLLGLDSPPDGPGRRDASVGRSGRS